MLYFETFAHGVHFRWISSTRPSGNHSITWSTRSDVEPLPMADLLLVSSYSHSMAITCLSFPSLSFSLSSSTSHIPAFQHLSRRVRMHGARHTFLSLPVPVYLFPSALRGRVHLPVIFGQDLRRTQWNRTREGCSSGSNLSLVYSRPG